MSTIVERGLARCPRCVAVADYTFVESGPGSVRYEVRCAKCGEAYSEVNAPAAQEFRTTSVALMPSPEAPARVVGAGWLRVLSYLARARQHWHGLLNRRWPSEPPA